MARFEITVDNAVLVEDKKKLRGVLRDLGKELTNDARQLIMSSSGGPGSAPQNKTGKLAADLSFKLKGDTLIVSDKAFYALALEAGGKASKRKGGKDKRGKNVSNWVLPARPFLSVALADMENTNIGQRVADAVLNGLSLKTTKR